MMVVMTSPTDTVGEGIVYRLSLCPVHSFIHLVTYCYRDIS